MYKERVYVKLNTVNFVSDAAAHVSTGETVRAKANFVVVAGTNGDDEEI